jgi:regulator of sirC expression with transglutaminase-like and TPR domain
MKLSVQSGEIVLDPVSGISLSREDLEERLEPYLAQNVERNAPLSAYLQEAEPREILVRMLRNLKALYFERADWELALGVQQRLVILLPQDIAERRDRGMAFANLECPQAALRDIEDYLEQRPHAQDAPMLRQLLSNLRDAARRLN